MTIWVKAAEAKKDSDKVLKDLRDQEYAYVTKEIARLINDAISKGLDAITIEIDMKYTFHDIKMELLRDGYKVGVETFRGIGTPNKMTIKWG